MKKNALILSAIAISTVPAFGQKPIAPARPVEDGQPPIEAVSSRTPVFRAPAQEGNAAEEAPPKPTLKKEKGPTEIDALAATFDQKTNVAVFIGEVVVKDPEFNVKCDKLTAHLKTTAKAAPALDPKLLLKPAPTPVAAPAKKPAGGGLQRAVAEANTGNRVVITQNKLQADGTTQRSVGTADRATYDAVTGDVVLTGKPEIQQGINLIMATSVTTKMTLNRDGHMRADGPHKTIIVDKGDTGI